MQKDSALEKLFLKTQQDKALARIAKSASGFVLVKRFNSRARAGLRRAIEDGLVQIIETSFGHAYSIVDTSKG